jgi:hypothetical protein
MTKRPIVPTMIRTEFGDVHDDPSFHDVSGADRDLTYIPGFSDMRRARDLVLADVASGKTPRHEAKLEPLPVNCRWVRRATPSGAPDGRKEISTGNLGYKAATKDMIGKQPWLKALPPGATLTADGMIQKGDTVLMFCDGATAARNAARKQAQTQRMVNDTSAAAGGLLNTGRTNSGADAYVQKEG